MHVQPASDEQWKRLRFDIGRLVARRVAGAADVEDIVQEVLIRVWRHRGRLRDNERFDSWLSRVVYNAVMDHLRSRAAYASLSNEDAVDAALPRISAGDGGHPSVRELIAAVLRPFVDQLPPLYRDAIILSELEQLSHPRIATRLSLSISGVKSRVQRGREQLKGILERCCEFALDARRAPLACVVKPDGILPSGCCVAERDVSARTRVGCALRFPEGAR